MYAAIADMVERFGEAEMIRLTTPSGEDAEVVVGERIDTAIADATATIESYLRARYALPLSPAPAEIRRVCCVLARFDLANGDGREPSEQMRLARKEAIDWLCLVSRGDVQLAGAVRVTNGARVSDRLAAFRANGAGPI